MAGQMAGPGGVPNPFAVQSMRIHPLTRLDKQPDGQTWLVVHVELKDAWGDTTKGVGQLQVQLYRPTGGRAAGPGVQELKWDANLSDLERNAWLYDPATRTYRLQLEGIPEWVSVAPADSGLPRARLKAILTTPGPNNEQQVLEDEFTIQG
jgi:hypothetical protein